MIQVSNEINIDISKPAIKYKINFIIKQQDKHSKISYRTMQHEQSINMYKPGETMTGVLNEWSARYNQQGANDQGCWSWISLNGRRGKQILIMYVYRVSQKYPSRASEGSACQQQYRYQLKIKKSPNPKNQCLTDILALLAF